ncbi:MAG: 30S ribosomal protein S6 [Planctomycetota bacterium]
MSAPTANEDAKPLYEGLFLFAPSAGADLDATLQMVREMIERVDGEIVTLARWDERKLAYPIETMKRGLYILTLFRATGSRIVSIERDCNLSEEVVRVMICRADHMGELEIEAAKNGAQTATEIEEFKDGGKSPDADAPAEAEAKPDAEPATAEA